MKNISIKNLMVTLLMTALTTACSAAGINIGNVVDNAPSLTKTAVIQAATEANPSLEMNTNTPVPDLPKSTPTENQFFWSTSFETADLSELQRVGDFVRQGPGYFKMVSAPAHSGNYAVGLTIDTSQESPTGDHAAYLFFWEGLPEDAYYYSAWYYIPSTTRPKFWWNIWQWKSTYDGDSNNSQRIFSIGVNETGGGWALHLNYKLPGMENLTYYQEVATVPFDRWFQIEGYYKKSTGPSGQVILWQDGVELLNIQNVQTVLDDETVFWSVNNYTDEIRPYPCTIYIDDMVVSSQRIGTVIAGNTP